MTFSLAAFRNFLGNLPWSAVLGALVATLVAVVVLEVSRINQLREQATVAATNAAANAAIALKERQLRAHADDVSADIARKLRLQQARSASRARQIEGAPPSDDGPVAPVLRAALDGLRAKSDPTYSRPDRGSR